MLLRFLCNNISHTCRHSRHYQHINDIHLRGYHKIVAVITHYYRTNHDGYHQIRKSVEQRRSNLEDRNRTQILKKPMLFFFRQFPVTRVCDIRIFAVYLVGDGNILDYHQY